jgi:hypothetical protein
MFTNMNNGLAQGSMDSDRFIYVDIELLNISSLPFV